MNKKLIESIDQDNMFAVIRDLYKHIEHSFEIIKSSHVDSNNLYNNVYEIYDIIPRHPYTKMIKYD